MPRRGAVQMATQRELDVLAERDPAVKRGESAAAALALRLAARVDDTKTGADGMAKCAAQLREAMAEVRAAAPPAPQRDHVDDSKDQLAARRAEIAARAPGAGAGG